MDVVNSNNEGWMDSDGEQKTTLWQRQALRHGRQTCHEGNWKRQGRQTGRWLWKIPASLPMILLLLVLCLSYETRKVVGGRREVWFLNYVSNMAATEKTKRWKLVSSSGHNFGASPILSNSNMNLLGIQMTAYTFWGGVKRTMMITKALFLRVVRWRREEEVLCARLFLYRDAAFHCALSFYASPYARMGIFDSWSIVRCDICICCCLCSLRRTSFCSAYAHYCDLNNNKRDLCCATRYRAPYAHTLSPAMMMTYVHYIA